MIAKVLTIDESIPSCHTRSSHRLFNGHHPSGHQVIRQDDAIFLMNIKLLIILSHSKNFIFFRTARNLMLTRCCTLLRFRKKLPKMTFVGTMTSVKWNFCVWRNLTDYPFVSFYIHVYTIVFNRIHFTLVFKYRKGREIRRNWVDKNWLVVGTDRLSLEMQ